MDRKHCYFCFIDELGLCDVCLTGINTCFNCLAYGNGGLCLNCETNGDEGVDLNNDLLEIFYWIQRNDSYFLSKTNIP
jgi:hypothetical protein